MSEKSTIIFLDIDGVMIPGRSYMYPSKEGIKMGANIPFDPVAVNMVKMICDKFSAKIVTNTYWNMQPEKLFGCFEIFEMNEWTFSGSVIDQSSRTRYPDIRNRLDAIGRWIYENLGEMDLDKVNWVAFDDYKLEHKKAIRINPYEGITFTNHIEAFHILGDTSYDPKIAF